MTTVVKMVGKGVENIEEIRVYIKVRKKLGYSVKQISTELGDVYGSQNVSYVTVHRWGKKYYTGTVSVKDATKSGRPVIATGKTNVSKVREIIDSDGRYMIREIVKAVGIVSIFHSEVYFESTNTFC